MTGKPTMAQRVARKRDQALAMHDEVLRLALIPGREKHANTVSREAAKLDAEVELLEAGRKGGNITAAGLAAIEGRL